MNDNPKNNLSYEDALHGIQTGVAMEIEGKMNDATTPKHLRVGIDSAHVSHAALIRLLLDKKLITIDEYQEELRLETNRELDRYESRVRQHYGNHDIKLR